MERDTMNLVEAAASRPGEGPPRGAGSAALARHHAIRDLFSHLEGMCEGTLIVDADSRIAWISDKYRHLLEIPDSDNVIGRDVEQVIPRSLMRQVVQTGEAIPVDLMQFGERWFVVTRIPVTDGKGSVVGAVGFVLYPRADSLRPVVSRFMELQRELESVRRELAQNRRAKYSFSHFVGSHPALLTVRQQARRAARLDTTILLLGETGTGKDLMAHAIHAASRRAEKPLVSVNVAAIPETLLEAEFFGVAPGAYTGAERKGRQGRFQLADGGTLFLDEIGDMPLALQTKLLRALQDQEIEPLGSTRIQKVDVRVIAATSCDLPERVRQGRFRSDLYYRLNILPITLPPLRERVSDLEALCEALLERISTGQGGPVREILPETVELLRSHGWPGNVRELRNVLERACALTDSARLAPSHVRAVVTLAPEERAASAGPVVRPLDEVVAEAEREAIARALRASGGNKVKAARELGISRARLYDRLYRHGMMYEELTDCRNSAHSQANGKPRNIADSTPDDHVAV